MALGFYVGLDGVAHENENRFTSFHGEDARLMIHTLWKSRTSKVHPFVEHLKFPGKQFEDENNVAKQTIPAPAQFIEQGSCRLRWKIRQSIMTALISWQRILQTDIKR